MKRTFKADRKSERRTSSSCSSLSSSSSLAKTSPPPAKDLAKTSANSAKTSSPRRLTAAEFQKYRKNSKNHPVHRDLRIQITRQNFQVESLTRRCSGLFSPQNFHITIISGEFPNVLFDGDKHCSFFNCGYRVIFDFFENDLSDPTFDEMSNMSIKEQIFKFCREKMKSQTTQTTIQLKTTTTTTTTTTAAAAEAKTKNKNILAKSEDILAKSENNINQTLRFPNPSDHSDLYQKFVTRVDSMTAGLLKICSFTRPIQRVSFFFPRMFDVPQHFKDLKSFVTDVFSSRCIYLDLRQELSELNPVCHPKSFNRVMMMKNINQEKKRKHYSRDLSPEKSSLANESSGSKDDRMLNFPAKKIKEEGLAESAKLSELAEKGKVQKKEKKTSFVFENGHYCQELRDFPKKPKFCRLVSGRKCSLIELLMFFPQIKGDMFSGITSRLGEENNKRRLIIPFQTDCADNFVKMLNVFCSFLEVDYEQSFCLVKSENMNPLL